MGGRHPLGAPNPDAIGPEFDRAPGKERVYLDLRSDGLKRHPWELLRSGNWNVFTAGKTAWCFGRPDPTTDENAGTPPPVEHPVRVLIVLGNRPDDTNIRARQELMIIERSAHRHNTDVLLRALLYPTARDSEDALETFRPHLFHFIGHGGKDAKAPPQIWVYSREAGISEPWDANRVRTVFSQHPPRVVILNACQTAHTAWPRPSTRPTSRGPSGWPGRSTSGCAGSAAGSCGTCAPRSGDRSSPGSDARRSAVAGVLHRAAQRDVQVLAGLRPMPEGMLRLVTSARGLRPPGSRP